MQDLETNEEYLPSLQEDKSFNFYKRLIDILGGIVGIIIFSPIMIITAICIKLDSKGPVFADTPMRVGKNGKHFKMYKFRSMVVNAHKILQKDQKLLEEYKKNSYKIIDDPRITNVGKLIRKVSIDEMPQFFNVLKGDMSIVGIRPYYPFELEEQQQKYPQSKKFVKIVLQSKPGITGVWQVSGRSNINFDKRVEMDAGYVQKKSILYDLQLILRTIPVVLLGKGAI
ncbi:MAG: sugar transferase [Candidatus Daviesbacteria bacterium]|nr:sugar transferase [Candidatus Daviesbacteria bacterium]